MVNKNARRAHSQSDTENKTRADVPLGSVSVLVQDVTVKYRTQTSDQKALKTASFKEVVKYRVFGRRPKYIVNALRSISFAARQGESVGLVGLNGSGKSTLLRVIAGSEPPTSGVVKASAQPILLGVSAALLPDLPGIENIRIGCYAMGMSPQETKEAIPRVVALADIGDAIYLPMKTYSSGMGSRLRFAIATASRPDILLIDEALNTGDASFRERSEEAMTEMRKSAGTVFLVSHAAQTIENLCSRAIWLHKGRIVADGDAYTVARHYRQWSWHLAKGKPDKADDVMQLAIEQHAPSTGLQVLGESKDEFFPRHVTKPI